ncbi:DUF1015 family protein [Bacillus pacificus]
MKKAGESLNRLIREEVFIQDEEPALYIYELTMREERSQALSFVHLLMSMKTIQLKKHERTRHEKELDRIRHVDVCDANTGPIFLTYRTKEEVKRFIAKLERRTCANLYIYSERTALGMLLENS